MKSQVLIIFAISLLIFDANSLNILFTSELASPSHHIYNSALARALAARGHNVTFVSADLVENPPENLHYVHMEYQYKMMDDFMPGVDIGTFFKEFINMGRIGNLLMWSGFGYEVCTELTKNKGFSVIMDYPDDFKFDLMIYDYTMLPCMLGLVHKFNYPPLVGITAFCNPLTTSDIVGGDKLGLTVKPHYMLSYDKNMNILQRLDNGFLNFFESLIRKYYAIPAIDKQMKAMYGSDLPYVGDLEKLMQIALVNSHPAIEFAESLPPNVIEIGGMQIADPKPVEKELDEFLLNGKKGSVLMSMGSNFKSEYLDESVITSILEAFRQLPEYNFIWKFENSDKLKDLPQNVMIRPWLSQNDILAHENVKAFISHSGMLSTLESTWQGVPIVGIPLFMDQIRNLKKSENAGVAVKVDIQTLTTEKLKAALLEVLENPKYQQNMKLRSELFRDQPQKPLDRAVWWCEYVMRNPTATHLRPIEFNFGLLGSHFWDIQLISIVLIVLIILVIRCGCKKICRKFCKCKNSGEKRKTDYPSHHIFNSALARELAARGHNVTFVSADLVINPPENLHYIHLEYQYKIFEKFIPDVDPGEFLKEFIKTGRFGNLLIMSGYGYDYYRAYYEFLNKGKKGSVLMSMGSNFKSEYLEEATINSIVEVFRQLPDYNFIWKFENSDKLKELPKNVMIRPWLSQNNILAHKNVKAFISHAGMMSTLESSWHGVPVVGIPLFMDQIRNLKKGVNAGVAIKVDLQTITTEKLKAALLEVLENPKYQQNMNLRSKLFRDQPEKPLDRAVWWCEYVMRNPKATHLKLVEFSLGLVGYQFWDVQVISIILILLAIKVLRCGFKKVYSSICGSFSNRRKVDGMKKKE